MKEAVGEEKEEIEEKDPVDLMSPAAEQEEDGKEKEEEGNGRSPFIPDFFPPPTPIWSVIEVFFLFRLLLRSAGSAFFSIPR